MMIKLLTILTLTLAVPAAAVEPPVAPTPPVAPVAAVAPTPPAPPPAPVVATLTPAQIRANEVVCKSQLETGSLVKKRKQCLTRKQWAYVNDAHESFARHMVEDNAGRPSGN